MVVGKIIHAMYPYQKLRYSYHWSSLLFVPVQFSEESKQKSQEQSGLASGPLKLPLAPFPGFQATSTFADQEWDCTAGAVTRSRIDYRAALGMFIQPSSPNKGRFL